MREIGNAKSVGNSIDLIRTGLAGQTAELLTALAELEDEAAGFVAEAAAIRSQTEATMAERDREHAAEVRRLRLETESKEAKVKEIQSKFAFVLGTVTERSAIK